MTRTIITDPLDRFLWGVLAAVFVIGAIQYIRNAKRKESSEERWILYGFGILFIGYATVWTLWSFGELLHPGEYIGYSYTSEADLFTNPVDFYGFLFAGSSLTIYIFCFEKSIKRTKYIISLTAAILFTISLITYPIVGKFIFTYIFTTFIWIWFILTIFYITKTASYEFKAIGSIWLIGFIIYEVGDALHNGDTKELNLVPPFLAPLMLIIGGIVMLSPAFLDPKHYLKGKVYWFILSVFSLVLLWGMGIWFMIIGPIDIVFFFIFIVFTLVVIRTLFILDFEPRKSKEGEQFELLKAFSKPQKLTEEEVSISKEKKICLVCKNTIGGINFLCFECGAFYCEKCFRALSELENACWACDHPLDATKPVKLSKEDIEDNITEENIMKKDKGRKL